MRNSEQYDAVCDTDAQSESRTEEEDWEADIRMKRRQSRMTLWGRLKSYRWIIDTALLFIIATLLAEKRWKSHKKHRGQQYEATGDITGFAPIFSQVVVKFEPNPIFAPENASDFWGEPTQQAWLDIVPGGLGYVEIANPNLYINLPHPIHDYPNTTVYTTSMTHQLHCLYVILEAYNTLRLSPNPTFTANALKMPWHITHCFEYMRQAIMCAGDVALEGAATTFPPDEMTGEDQGGSDGWDARHVCKNYGEVFAYLEKKAVNHDKWIA